MNTQESLRDSLLQYNSKLSFSDFESLNLRGTARDTSHFYKHKHQNLYLRTRIVKGKIEWTNVTNHYEWDKILSNPEIPMFKFRKNTFLRFLFS